MTILQRRGALSTNPVMRILQRLLGAGLIACLATSLAAQDADTGRSAASAEPQIVRPVKLMRLEQTDTRLRRTFFGTVVARQTVNLAFQVSGQIHRFPVLEGATVAKGDLIAELDLEPFEIRLDRARTEKAQADRELARLQQLSRTTVSEAALENAQSAADLAANAVRDAEFSYRNASLKAPFDGIVASRDVANFSTVQAGTPVIRLHDISEWRVEIDVPEQLFRVAARDGDIETFGTFTGSERRIPLALREFRAEASSVGQTFLITLAMQEEPGPGVLPGSSMTVVASLPTDRRSVTVPPSAVVMGPDGETFVMVFESEDDDPDRGTVRRAAVELRAGPDGSFLLDESLPVGTEIVTAGAQLLQDGQSVRRFRGFDQ